MNQKRHTSPARRRDYHKSRSSTAPSLPKVEFDGARLFLQAGREKSLRRRHPWVFSGAVERLEGEAVSGDTVQVCDAQGGFLAWAAFNSQSQIIARVWSWQAQDKIDADFFRRKISTAIAARKALKLDQHSNGMRLIHGESDALPGLIVDLYADVLVLQLGSAGTERWRETIADVLQELCSPVCIYERSDSDGRELEGLPRCNEILRGQLPDTLSITENGIRIAVDVAAGQKTGFYLDQRDNRALVDELAEGREVLNCFCYTGGFSLYALRGGAQSVLSIDSSAEALQLAQRNVELNGFDAGRAEWQDKDVFEALRKLRDQNRKFDLIVLDPPKFAPTAAFAEKAARAYKDINLLGFKLLRPGGILATFSCSGGISDDLFQKIIAGAALDAGVDAQIVHKLHAAADHPVLLSFPEGAYLKGMVLRVAG
ncbi:MAG: class I SAM-dependent methyltransferase [Gammaproteobacteria bacterium]|nr:class I SAM-dependent methyltransferase [Gammaproteobacteria bacterium]